MPPTLDLNSLGNLFLYLTAFLGAFVAALWLSLIFWSYRDARQRTDDRLAHVLAAVVVALLGPPGLVIYLILRPPHTLEDVYQRAIEEEALLGEIAHREQCPGCGADVDVSWQVCPRCHTRLRKPCRQCGQLMDLGWQVCPHCAAPVERARNDAPGSHRPISG
ncbi:MAG: zinc ribbon domain-containing protein [Anaerolineales bacterium]